MASSGSKKGRANGKKFERYLAAMGREIEKIVGNVKDIEGADAAIARLRRYERAMAKWADETARKMVTEADKINARDWVNWDKNQRAEYVRGRKERGELISKSLRRERLTQPQNEMIQALTKEAAGYIKSVPEHVREELVAKAEELRNGGIRSEDFVNYVQSRGGVSESRARLIARTEVSRATTILTQSRAESVGSTHYIWRTAEDGIVRESHRRMNGKVVAWNDPPTLDGLTGHAGALPNCRCYPEPLIPEELGVSAYEQSEGLVSEYHPRAENSPEVLDDFAQEDTNVDFRELGSGKGDTDGISIITSKEPFDIEDSKVVELAFNRFAKETVESAIEKAVVISPDGHKYEIDGRSYVVGIHIAGEETLKGAKVVHNHPGVNADSFSEKNDFAGFFKYEIKTLEVVYNGKRHRMEWHGKRLTENEARDVYENALLNVNDEARKKKASVENEQYSVMEYLRKHRKELKFREL
jgi:SPP1 gp7 family putative phage head morphogenesis protein